MIGPIIASLPNFKHQSRGVSITRNPTIRRPILYRNGPLISHQIRIIFFIFPNSNEANQQNVGIVSWFKHSLTMRKSCAHFFGPSVFDIVCISQINTYYNAQQAALKTLHTFWNDLKCVTLFDKDVDRSAKKTSVWCLRHEYKTHISSLSIIERWKHLRWYFVVCTIYLFFKYKCI